MNPTQEPLSVSRKIGDREITIETGRIARQAHGSVTVRCGETVVFVAVTTGTPREGIDFFPLTVDYREVFAAAGKIPGGFFKREGRPTTKEILTCRLIDRPIRPLFPEGFKDEVMVSARVFSADGDNDPDVLGVIAASAALAISSIPFDGPIGATRIGRVAGGELIVNPTYVERDNGDLDLTVAGTKDAICMVEAGANEVSEADMLDAMLLGHKTCQDIAALIDELVTKCGTVKAEFSSPDADDEAAAIVAPHVARLAELSMTPGKHARKQALSAHRKEIIAKHFEDAGIEADGQRGWKKRVSKAYDSASKKVVRDGILDNGKRCDGRGCEDIRNITIEPSVYPRSHGSAIFTRGETQAVVSATLGTTRDEQRLEGLREQTFNRFMLHYNFPSYCVGETWANRGPKRREIGHGNLAERAVRAVMPNSQNFPYTVRIVSEITESNGSSSMATICGGTIALMDAGVAIKRPVAGIAMGLISDGERTAVLSDILGTEDACGDMDFKVAGTQKGITALQMDIKIKGLSREVLEKALEQARKGRFHILKVMLDSLSAPRPKVSPYAPRIVSVPIQKEKIGLLIGPGGKTIRRIQDETLCKIDIDEPAGSVYIAGTFESRLDECVAIVRDLVRDVEIGAVYNGRVSGIKDFGAFIEILPGKEGLLPVEEFAERGGPRVRMQDEVSFGEEMVVKVIDVDPIGRIRLSKRAVKEEDREAVGAGASAGA